MLDKLIVTSATVIFVVAGLFVYVGVIGLIGKALETGWRWFLGEKEE